MEKVVLLNNVLQVSRLSRNSMVQHAENIRHNFTRDFQNENKRNFWLSFSFKTLPSRVINLYVTLRQKQRFLFGIPALQMSKFDMF